MPDHELLSLIGRGSYGEVWLGRNTLGAWRAIKIVYESTFRHRRPFEREFNGVKKFEPVSRLHDGLMDVLHAGRDEAGGYFYCVMELADDVDTGQSIDPENYSPRTLAHEIVKWKRLPIPECRRIGVAIAGALDFLHSRGLIHRDVKPSNIVFVDGVPKLADIGLVAEMTEARSYVGTEGFIPPEGPGTAQADIYSFGKVLYEISTGMDRHDYPELPGDIDDPLQEDELIEFHAIVLQACRTDPRQRYKSAGRIVADIQALERGGHRIRKARRKLVRIGSLAVLGAGLVAALGLLTRGEQADHFPVSWWRGENSGEDALGLNHGTPAGTNGVSYGPGISGRAFVFDGTHRDRLDLGNPPGLQLQNFTIEAWIKRSNPTNISLDDLQDDNSRAGEGGMILAYGFTGYGFCLYNDGRLVLSEIGISGVTSSKSVSDTNWHHVAVTKSGSAVRFYLDGEPASRELSYDSIFYFDSSVAIGSLGDGLGCTFWGQIDEVAIDREALPAVDIREIFRAGANARYLRRLRPFVPPPEGLVDWWTADGHTRGVSGDTNAVLVNGATFAPGKVGKAFRLNGNEQCVRVPRRSKFDVGEQLTIALWMNAAPKNFQEGYHGLLSTDFYSLGIFTGYNNSRRGIVFGLSSDGGSMDSVESFPNTADANDGGAVVTAGQWHHVAGTYDGSKLQLYIDGRHWGKPMIHSGAIAPMTPDGFLCIGSEDGRTAPGSKGRYFKGLIDEVALYNRALSGDEIEYLYQAGCAGQSLASRGPGG